MAIIWKLVLKLKKSELINSLLLYAVSDNSWSGNRTLAEQIQEALQGGVTMLQLREKKLPHAAFLHEALAVKQIAKQFNVPLLINDDLEIACQSDADGLHIGQDDCPVYEARRMLGANKILGVSAQTVEQAKQAEAAGADYLGVGAVFSTSTKTDAKYVSLPLLKEICQSVKIPVVAIGGIDAHNISQLANTGIAGVAVVSAIFSKPDIALACQNLKEILNNTI